MENPGRLLNKARQNRRFRGVEKREGERVSVPNIPEREPPHQSSHAGYSALMRSHDRMRTRHIAGQGAKGGA